MGNMAERLRQLRDRQNYKQEGMANAAGVSQRTWSTWEADPPSQFEALRKLCVHFNVSADYLLGLTDDPTAADARGAGWDEVVIDIANKVMTLPPHRRINVQMAVEAIVGREEAVRRAEELAHLAETYYTALRAADAAVSDLVGQEEHTTIRQRWIGALSIAPPDSVIEAVED